MVNVPSNFFQSGIGQVTRKLLRVGSGRSVSEVTESPGFDSWDKKVDQ